MHILQRSHQKSDYNSRRAAKIDPFFLSSISKIQFSFFSFYVSFLSIHFNNQEKLNYFELNYQVCIIMMNVTINRSK